MQLPGMAAGRPNKTRKKPKEVQAGPGGHGWSCGDGSCIGRGWFEAGLLVPVGLLYWARRLRALLAGCCGTYIRRPHADCPGGSCRSASAALGCQQPWAVAELLTWPHCCSGVARCRFAPHPRRLIVRGGGCAASPGAAALPCKPQCCPPLPRCLRRRPAPGPHSSSPS